MKIHPLYTAVSLVLLCASFAFAQEEPPERPKVVIGINLGTDEMGRAQVTGVMEGLPAQKAGMKAGDIIVKVAGANIRNAQDLIAALVGKEPGEDLAFTVEREGEWIELTLVPAPRSEMPAPEPAPALDGEEVREIGRKVRERGDEEAQWKPLRSVQYILDAQKADGTWDIGMQVNPDTGGGITVGTSALTCLALLDYWDIAPEKIRPVLEKGIRGCLQKVHRREERFRDFGSTQWGQAYTIELMARLMRHPEWKDRSEKWKKEAEDISKWLFLHQSPGGGFGYRNSFQTGAAVISFKEAEESGIALDETHVRKAVEFLKGLRTEEMGYRYSLPQSERELAAVGGLQDGIGRLGVGEWGLLLYDETTPEELQKTMGWFMEGRDFLWGTREMIKENQWPRAASGASPYAYFPFFGYRYSALALKGVPGEQGKKWAALLREDLMRIKEPDDTWINLPKSFEVSDEQKTRGYADNTEPGSKIYATAMSLMALKDLDGILNQ